MIITVAVVPLGEVVIVQPVENMLFLFSILTPVSTMPLRLRTVIAFLIHLTSVVAQVDGAPKLFQFSFRDIELRQAPPAAIPTLPDLPSSSPRPISSPLAPDANTTTSTSTTIPLYGQTTTTPTYSVNLTPFGGSLLPSVPNSEFESIRITISSTAGFPALTGYSTCGES